MATNRDAVLAIVGSGNASGTGYVPRTNDYAGIMAAYNSAVAAGGGTIQLLPVTYNIGGNTLPVSPGIRYKGAGYTITTPTNIIDGYLTTLTGGTIINGNGTAIGFGSYVPGTGFTSTDLAAIPGGIYNQLSITGASVEDLAITNCTYGIKIGGLYNLGSAYCRFKNIGTFNCPIWGQWYENCIHTLWDEIVDINSGTSAAWNQDAGGVSFAFSINGYNNSEVISCLASSGTNLLTKVVQFIARDPNAQNSGNTGGISTGNFLQGNKFNATAFTPQTVTGNGTANIAVTDYTKFAVGLPVVFQNYGGGLNYPQVYSVTSVSNTGFITISDQMGNANIVMSVGTNVINHLGFAPLTAMSMNSNCVINFGKWQTIDSEGFGTCMLYINRGFGTDYLPTENIGRNASQSVVDICIRSSSVVLNSVYGTQAILDIDNTSSERSSVIGASGFALANNSQVPPTSLLASDPSQPGNVASLNINIRPQGRGASFSAQIPAPYNADWIKPGPPLGVSQGYSATGTQAVNLSNGTQGWGVYTGSGAATWTFTGGLNSRMQGFRQTFKNQGTGALTITLSSTDGTFDGLTGGTSLGKSMLLAAPTAIALGGCITMICSQIGASTYQWEVESVVNATLV
jgi:hypothetical protein